MSSTNQKVIDAAIATFIRYGARKTSMSDIADAAGVSRQTVYDQFGTKDELVAAAISRNTDLVLGRVADQLGCCRTLSERLEIYLVETVVRTFERLQSSEDVEDLISGHSDAGRTAIAKSHQRHKRVVASLLAPYQEQIASTGQSASQLAGFFVKCAMNLKHCEGRRELNAMLFSLKTLVLLAAAPLEVEPTARSTVAAQAN